MPIKTSSAKAKGRKFQQSLRDRILAKFAEELEEGDVVSTSMGAGGVDVQLSPLAKRVFPVSIEAKATRKHPAMAEMKQAQANIYKNTTAAVCWSPHGTGPQDSMITFNFDDFLDLVVELQAGIYHKGEGK